MIEVASNPIVQSVCNSIGLRPPAMIGSIVRERPSKSCALFFGIWSKRRASDRLKNLAAALIGISLLSHLFSTLRRWSCRLGIHFATRSSKFIRQRGPSP